MNNESLGIKTRNCPLRCLFSNVGVKIAVPVAFLMFLPVLSHVVFYEYRTEDWREVAEILSMPYYWGGLFVALACMTAVLFKVVIIPLKRFERHIQALEQGKGVGELKIDSKDEIGFLAERFNKLQDVFTGQIQEKDARLNVIYDFTHAASGVFDIPTLMDSFFRILATIVDFDTGAYLLCYKNHKDGKFYPASGSFSGDWQKEVIRRLSVPGDGFCKDFNEDEIKDFTVTYIRGKNLRQDAFSQGFPVYSVEVPLNYNGRHIGVITLFSYSNPELSRASSSKIFNAMCQHAATVIERLLTHTFDEERKLSGILSSLNEGIYVVDKNGVTTSANKKGLELMASQCKFSASDCSTTGVEPSLGACPHAEKDPCAFSNIFKKAKELGEGLGNNAYMEEVANADGSIILITITELKIGNDKGGFIITAKDVTEDRLIQKRIMLSSKLAALGEMAAGIAHEVNNPLQVIMANVELQEGAADGGGREAKSLLQIKEGIFRIKAIVKDLLIFARGQTTENAETDINAVAQKSAEMMRRQLKLAGIEVHLSLDEGVCQARCNANLLQQVLINLLQNAKDAIEESGRGSRVAIKTLVVNIGVVCVEVSDDGPGIPEKIIDRIFDPFFTTKDVGKGTGLGLSVSRRIVEGMGGSISVVSRDGRGTTFSIALPSALTEDAGADKGEADANMGDYSCLSGKSVIVIDDEEGVVKAIKDALEPSVGFVDGASSGAEAIEMLMDRDYDLIVLDVKMPGFGGMEVYKRVSAVKPYLAERIIFITGDFESEATESFLKLTGCKYLTKPFAMQDLYNAMRAYEFDMTEVIP